MTKDQRSKGIAVSARKSRRSLVSIVAAAGAVGLFAGCGWPTPASTPVPTPAAATAAPRPGRADGSATTPPTAAPPAIATNTPSAAPRSGDPVAGLSEAQVASLASLERVDDYPLYVMRIHGSYDQRASVPEDRERIPAEHEGTPSPAWSCSLFAALGGGDSRLYGRNFDWEYSPALLLFTDPPGGYASVSMVDIAYLGFEDTIVRSLVDQPLTERQALLRAPFLPFDGMNEKGLVIGMAAVPAAEMPHDSSKETSDSLEVIREMLDHAQDVEEAVGILQSYNIDWGGGPPLHYLLADASGNAVLVEFFRGEVLLVPSEGGSSAGWHAATNFLRSAVGESARGVCPRYDHISHCLSETAGQLGPEEALNLLDDVSQHNTQWSVVYEMGSGEVKVTLGRRFDTVHTFPTGFSGE